MTARSLLLVLVVGASRASGWMAPPDRDLPVTTSTPDSLPLPGPPGPIVVGPKGNVVAGDTLRYTISWGPGQYATSYDVTRSVTATNGVWTVVADSQSGAVKSIGSVPLPNTFSYTRVTLSHRMWVAAIPWDSATFTVSIVSRNARGTNPQASVATWSIGRKPGPPGPITIDSSLAIVGLRILPDSVRLAVGGGVQFCALVRFSNGTYALRSGDITTDVCPALYLQTIPAAQRLVSLSQQARADSVCVVWSATGGTIEPEVCNNPALLKQRGLLYTVAIGRP